MNQPKNLFEAAKKTFNNIKVLKGQYINIATADAEGTPNVAPIASMRIVDENTVHMLQGFLPRTMANLKQNPKAVFSVCKPPSFKDMFTLFKEEDDDLLGYRVLGTLSRISADKEEVSLEKEQLLGRVPFLLHRPFRKFCDKNLKRLLVFHLDKVWDIGGER